MTRSPHKPARRWKRLDAALIAVFAGVALIGGCASGHVAPPAQPAIARAKAAYARQDYETAARLLAPLAMRGDAEAQYALGYMHYYGRGVRPDRYRAIRWFEHASSLGNAKAREALALLDERSAAKAHTPTKRDEAAPNRPKGSYAVPDTPAPVVADTGVGQEGVEAPVSPCRPQVPISVPVLKAAALDHGLERKPGGAGKERAAPIGRATAPSGYTLQLIGSRSKKDLAELVRRHGLEEKTFSVTAEYKGRPWHRLLYGRYETVAEARQALKGLPVALTRHKPWVRRIPPMATAAAARSG